MVGITTLKRGHHLMRGNEARTHHHRKQNGDDKHHQND
ncbi:hypothetical protein LOT_2034 [Lentilactobacillus otakiensis DSM 19908 = JCM 15040]|uniref:Uncharacterized protein n=1 Tax=Lentilactobacillus otakiensis DSM 19908 = JCM 15040 TaxID=1423780 RepID=S4NNU3_9LACO|nr:hypothetical protein LOT_2034 [Lentilactobacillus otakiensis DSM 19908 = JCM 15040]